jgi:hypothetical protein
MLCIMEERGHRWGCRRQLQAEVRKQAVQWCATGRSRGIFHAKLGILDFILRSLEGC